MRALAVLLLSPALVSAQALEPGLISRIDALFAESNRPGVPGYAVGIVRDGRLIFAKGYGRANLDEDLPITSATVFHLASLSKQFTGAAVALLVLDGKLRLEDPVSAFFPEVAAFAPELRVEHLLYFTSGLPDYTTLPRKSGRPWFSYHYFDTDEAIRTVLDAKTLQFKPGTKWAYSNVNYMLLAKIVEQRSGMGLGAFLEARVFAPLGMKATHLDDDSSRIVPHRAIGYAPRGNARVQQAFADVGVRVAPGEGYLRLQRVSPHYGGSGVFSTLEDLARWQAHFEHPALGPAFVELMLRRHRFEHPKDNDALGIVHGAFRGQPLLWFSGSDLDTSTYMARLPQAKVSIIVLSNLLTGEAEAKAQAVLGLLESSFSASPAPRSTP